MIPTSSGLIVAKIEYLLKRKLADTERISFLKKIKVGNNKEICDAVTHLKASSSFSSITDIVAEHTQKQDLSKLSKEDLVDVVKDVVVRTASVQSGLKILRKAETMKRDTLLKYIFDLYLKDALARDKKIKTSNVETITNDQSNRPPDIENALGPGVRPYAYENVQKQDSLTDVKEYDSKDEYLRDEWRNRPSQNQPREPRDVRETLRQYFKPISTKPTGSPEDDGNQKV